MAAGRVTSLPGLIHEVLRLLAASARLRRSLAGWLLVGLVTSGGFTVAVALLHDPASLLPLTLIDAGAWLFISLIFIGGAPLLSTPDGRRIDYYGVPNGLSAVRAWLTIPLLMSATLSLPGSIGLYLWCAVGGATGLLDFVDGWIARRFGPVTTLGKAIDPTMDAIFFAMAAVGNWLLGIAPGWLAAGILVRYVGPFVATPFVFLVGKRPELVHTKWGRYNTAGIGLVLFILMIVRLAGGPVQLFALVIAPPLLLPTLVLHSIALVRRIGEAPSVA